MRAVEDQRGYSLIELMIVIGIMGILASAIFGAVGYINTGKTKKASNKLNNKLSYIQTETMTKKGDTYLYIYKTASGVYTCVLNGLDTDSPHPDGFYDRAELETYLSSHDAASKICDSTVKVTGIDSGGGSISLILDEDNMLKIGYSKSTGAFTYSNSGDPAEAEFYNRLELSGKEKFTIQLIKATGKHYIDS